mgnify:CR=1 FL=1
MATKKVEICGVNTSSLPLLSEEEKEDLFERIEQGDLLAREHYIKGIYDLFLVSSNDFQEAVKMQMIFFKLAASVL